MIKLTINGQPFSKENLESVLIKAFAAQIQEKLGAIRHPETGEFPTIAFTGSSLADMRFEIEGSPELIALAKQRLQGDDADGEASEAPDDDIRVSDIMSAPKVFLSYAFEDSMLAERIATALNANGIDTWWAGWCIGAGDSIRQKIDEGLGDCTHFIVLLTAQSIGKPWVSQEMDAGLMRKLNTGSKFIALRCGLPAGDLPPLLQGGLSPVVDAASFDVSQLVNDIHGISKKPPLGPAPAVVRANKATATGYSAAATTLAKYFVDATDYARKFEPLVEVADVASQTGLSVEDVIDAAHELRGLVTVRFGDRIHPEEELFVKFDKFWKDWDPAADALRVATALFNDPEFPTTPAEIAEEFGWEPRRLNPALSFLSQRGIIQDLRGVACGPWVMSFLRKTDETRRFVKSRQ